MDLRNGVRLEPGLEYHGSPCQGCFPAMRENGVSGRCFTSQKTNKQLTYSLLDIRPAGEEKTTAERLWTVDKVMVPACGVICGRVPVPASLELFHPSFALATREIGALNHVQAFVDGRFY